MENAEKKMDVDMREHYIQRLLKIQDAFFLGNKKLAEELGIGYNTLKKLISTPDLMVMCPSVMRKVKRYVDRQWPKIPREAA